MSGYPYIFQDLVDAGILCPVQPSASSGWTKYKTGREFSPGIVPGAVLDLHAERANGGVSPGVNSPPTTQWYDVSGNGNHGTLNGFTAWDGVTDGWTDDPALRSAGAQYVVCPDLGACESLTFTYEAWCNTDYVGLQALVSECGTNSIVMVGLDASSKAYGRVRSETSQDSSRQGTVVLTGGLHQLILAARGTSWMLYCDGAPVGAAVQMPSGGLATTATYVGARAAPFLAYHARGRLFAARTYAGVGFTQEQVAQNYAAGPEWDKRTASALTIPLTLGNTAWTVVGRYSGLWAHNDSLAHNLLTLRSGADARATIYKHTDNKLYASVNDGTDTASSASAAQTLAADTVNTFVARGTWGSTVNLSINGVPSTQGDASAVEAQNIDNLVIPGTAMGSIGPLVLSPTDKGANWQAAVEAAGFSDLMRLVRDYMAVGDYIVPFGYSSTAYMKEAD